MRPLGLVRHHTPPLSVPARANMLDWRYVWHGPVVLLTPQEGGAILGPTWHPVHAGNVWQPQ